MPALKILRFGLAIFLFFPAGRAVASGAVRADSLVQPLVPGLRVQELPVQLPNINNIRFAPDGRLTALGYDGRVHLLRDTDGDGLEDQDQLFWDKPTLSVPVGMVWAPEGLYVSSHGKVSLLRDLDGDGKADVEEIMASGWPPTDVASGGVDATGVTRDAAGNLYFGLIVADYSNAYRIKDGVSHYDLRSPRGTIQKWSARTHQLETVCTGIRVPYTLAFNGRGDLFVTDQEGETWMPNGNPLDELNQIIPGKNYGFPPRHPKWLPNLVSEPPVVAFGPQHQSTCGLVFNETGPNQKTFGPRDWAGDALVAGESRGKIWRVRLVKTPAGYIGREFTLARLAMLTLDLAISPRGELYVCCHSGQPDWGTGPNGLGKIFKISYADPGAPQPVAAWASGSMEVRIAFDRPLDPSVLDQRGAMRIEFGPFVSAADRYEKLKPPYQVVQQQEATPRGQLAVVTARLSASGKTLILTTDPHPQKASYALTIPGVRARGSQGSPATVDWLYTLEGVQAQFSAADPKFSWTNSWPHLDFAVAESFLRGAEAMDGARAENFHPGQLRLATLLKFPAGKYRLRLAADASFTMRLGPDENRSRQWTSGRPQAEESFTGGGGGIPLEVIFESRSDRLPRIIEALYFSDGDPRVRPVPMNWFYLPWAPEAETQIARLPASFDFSGADY